jgi:hypothetical protein
MQPDAFGRFAVDDPRFYGDAARKGGGAFSKRTGKPVVKSAEQTTRRGGFAGGCFAPISIACKLDWGNVHMRAFQDVTADWPLRIQGVGGDRFFKIKICRKTDDVPPWAWALEWNQNYRLIGFFGDEDLVRDAVSALPKLPGKLVPDGNRGVMRYREDRELPPAQDQPSGRCPSADDRPSTVWATHCGRSMICCRSHAHCLGDRVSSVTAQTPFGPSFGRAMSGSREPPAPMVRAHRSSQAAWADVWTFSVPRFDPLPFASHCRKRATANCSSGWCTSSGPDLTPATGRP